MAHECPTFPHRFTANDTDPPIVFVLRNGFLVADYTITLHLRRPDNSVVIKNAISLTGSKGKFQFDAGDLVAGLGQPAEVQSLNTASGRVQTSDKFLIDVEEEIA